MVDHDGLLGCDQRRRAQPLTCEGRVGGRREVRVCPERALEAEVEHLRAECGKHHPLPRNRARRRCDAVEEATGLGQGLLVLLRGLGMSNPDPQQQPPREVRVDRGKLIGELGWVIRPDVHDPTRDHDPLARLEHQPQLWQPRRAADPQRAVAQLLG